MQFISEPIYKQTVALNAIDAFQKATDFAKKYRVKNLDPQNGKIILDVTYIHKFFANITWVKEVVIKVKPLSSQISSIEFYGKPAISPHNIFLLPFFREKQINIDQFTFNIQTFFQKYKVKTPIVTYKKSKLNVDILFWPLEVLSILSFVLLLKYVFLIQELTNLNILIAILVLFITFQILLIIIFTRDCYLRDFNSYKNRMSWITIIGFTGFIGCFIYYIFILNKKK